VGAGPRRRVPQRQGDCFRVLTVSSISTVACRGTAVSSCESRALHVPARWHGNRRDFLVDPLIVTVVK